MASISTSGTYDFTQQFNVDQLIQEAFWRLQIDPSTRTPVDVKTAMTSINLQLRTWAADRQILGLIQREMFDSIAGQAFYALPPYVFNVLEVTKSNYTRNKDGIPYTNATGPIPPIANLFDDSLTGCSLNTRDDRVGFQFNTPQEIWYVGVRAFYDSASEQDQEYQNTYKINILYSNDGQTFYKTRSTPQVVYPSVCAESVITSLPPIQWWVLEWPPCAKWWAIQNTNGNILNLQQIYLAQPSTTTTRDQALDDMSSSNYMKLTTKYNPQQIPSQYYFNQKETASLYFYGNDYAQNNCFIYTGQEYAEDVTSLKQNINIVSKFYDPLVTSVAMRLSRKFRPDLYPSLLQEYANFALPTLKTDREKADKDFEYDMTNMWTV